MFPGPAFPGPATRRRGAKAAAEARGLGSRGVAPTAARYVADSRSYGCPSAAGGTLRPTTPARITMVRM